MARQGLYPSCHRERWPLVVGQPLNIGDPKVQVSDQGKMRNLWVVPAGNGALPPPLGTA